MHSLAHPPAHDPVNHPFCPPDARMAPRTAPSTAWRALRPLATLCAVAVLLPGCGGSGDDPAPVAVSGVVADGPLKDAKVCYDLNDDGICNNGEPEVLTDADGKYSLSIAAAAAGQHAVLAEVPATAVDKDTGAAVGVAFVLKAPPSGSAGAQAVFVSPLTTVVANTAADAGISVAEATARVQSQLGLAVSPLGDFTAAGAPPDLGLAARAVGQVMIGTATVAAKAGVAAEPAARLVREAVIGQLPVLGTALEASAGTEATPAQRIEAAAKAVATQLNLDEKTVGKLADALAQPTVASDAAGPFVSVRRFTYTDAGTYSYQIFTGDSSKTDADGAWLASEPRANLVNGEAIAFSRNQLYWTGSAWNNCDNGFAVVKTVAQTATAPQKSTYCGGSKSEGRTTWKDIGGKTLREVIADMRAYPFRDSPGSTTDASGLPVKWGPDPALLPADAKFPEGSRYNTRRTTSDIGSTDRIEISVRPTVRYADGVFRQPTTLEQLGLMAGNLVVAGTVVTNLNSLFVDDVALDSQPNASLQAFKRWRLSVDVPGLKGRFYRCDLALNGNSQSCEAVGDATLAVQTQGGIRLLRVVSGYPAALKDRVQRQRFWAEHVGTVFRGTTDLERSYHDQRLNKPAWDAVRTALGIPEPVVPAAPAAAGAFRLLRNLSYTDAQNYSWRVYTGDESVVDTAGFFTVNETRGQLSAGAEVPLVRNRTYWSGSAWVVCPDSGAIIRAQGAAPFRSVLCQGYTDEATDNLVASLGGRLMSDVVNEIRSYTSTDAGGVGWGNWGTAASRVPALASTRFPAGATLSIRGGRTVSVPEAIATADGDRLRIAPSPTSAEPFANWPLATSLDQVIAGYPGSLLGSSVINGNVTLFVWRFTETPTNTSYTDQVEIRVAFDANGQKARFTRNNRLVSNGLSTSYQTILDTTYTIEQLGDARVLKFAAMPEGFEDRFQFTRRYAERGGLVWYAFKDAFPIGQLNWTQRLNGTAWDALRTVLGIQ